MDSVVDVSHFLQLLLLNIHHPPIINILIYMNKFVVQTSALLNFIVNYILFTNSVWTFLVCYCIVFFKWWLWIYLDLTISLRRYLAYWHIIFLLIWISFGFHWNIIVTFFYCYFSPFNQFFSISEYCKSDFVTT